ncbi:InlB B-repeat-containing protein [Bifidobacterium myosotis]|uniref:Peptidase M60 domain-containing protein n=1 Tax=Bifidobacterium myosotis TaxID=1630166 RepID=A0A5M9ZG04_9BIFI|nr:InlB B-repeat-containing protein [Bifidobacterium myosotis]KAA8825370.1 hypothetical protein EMO91_12460 [Bifidobacterium myosotis]
MIHPLRPLAALAIAAALAAPPDAAWASPAAGPAAPAAEAAEWNLGIGGPTTVTLSTVGSKDTDRARTQQYFQFENADWTGYYIRPGIKARFKITLKSDSKTPNVLWAHRQAGRVDRNDYALVRMDDGGKLKAGDNVIEYDTTGRRVGQVLYIRNDGTDPATVTIESMDGSDGRPSLGRYPYYEYDAADPQGFWTYLTELRAYVAAGVDAKAGDMNDDPALGMDVTSIATGRMVYELRAAKLVETLKDVDSEEKAVAWIENVADVSESRLGFFDRLQGFDAKDADAKQRPTRMKVVLELTQNLTSPSSMFAWYTMYHLPESVFPAVADNVDGSHGWANDHEFGHMLDIAPLARVEETNNLFSLWGRHRAGEARVQAGGAFATDVYHGNAVASQKQITSYLDKRLTDDKATSQWGDIWWDVDAKWLLLRWFDGYDYSGYDFAKYPAYSPEKAVQVAEYGGLGAVYRRVRANPADYRVVGDNAGNAMIGATAKAYSDALGFDMADVLERYGATVPDEVRTYTSRYPKLDAKIQYFTFDADAKDMNKAGLFDDKTAGPSLEAKRGADGGLDVTASYPVGSPEAATVSGFELLKAGRPVSYNTTGVFTVDTSDFADYTVVAYDRRANPSPETRVPSTAGIQVKVLAGDDGDPSKATVTVTPDDGGRPSTAHPDANGDLTLTDVPSSTITVALDGYTPIPARTHVDGYAWHGGVIQFTLAPKDGRTLRTPRPTVTGVAGKDGRLAFAITPADGGDDVYYTLDGSEPDSEHGLRWTGGELPITSSPLTVKAVAYRAGRTPSGVASATFTDTRRATIWNQIYGPAYGSGQSKSFGVGTYEAADLDFLTDEVRSLNVPAGLKVSIYEEPGLTGAVHVYNAGQINWVNMYASIKSKSIRVETVGAPEAKRAGAITFRSGAEDATGEMKTTIRFENVTMTAPDILYQRAGWTPTDWMGSDGNTYRPGDPLPDGDLTLTANWAKADYTIAYDPAGGAGVMGPVTTGVGAKVTLPESGFTRVGHTFAGWRLPDGTVHKAGERVDGMAKTAGETVTLTAVWRANTYRIRFDRNADDATGVMADQTVTYDGKTTLAANAFKRTGWTFAGWKGGNGDEYKDRAEILNLTAEDDAIVTLLAQWGKTTIPDPDPERPGSGEGGAAKPDSPGTGEGGVTKPDTDPAPADPDDDDPHPTPAEPSDGGLPPTDGPRTPSGGASAAPAGRLASTGVTGAALDAAGVLLALAGLAAAVRRRD